MHKFNEKTVRAVLTSTGVPGELHDQAWASLSAGYNKAHSLKCLFANLTAPVVVALALLFTKWEDENLPAWASWYDNDASINGDEFQWVNGEALPVSLDKNDAHALANCYWAPGHHPRSYWARWKWAGLRNRGKRSYEQPEQILPIEDLRAWGQVGITRGKPTVTGWQVQELHGYWQMSGVHPWRFGRFHEPNWGWKVGLWRLRYITNKHSRVMAVGVNLKLRKPK